MSEKNSHASVLGPTLFVFGLILWVIASAVGFRELSSSSILRIVAGCLLVAISIAVAFYFSVRWVRYLPILLLAGAARGLLALSGAKAANTEHLSSGEIIFYIIGFGICLSFAIPISRSVLSRLDRLLLAIFSILPIMGATKGDSDILLMVLMVLCLFYIWFRGKISTERRRAQRRW